MPFAISVASAANTAARAKLDPRFRGLRARLLVMALLYLGPLLRSFERYLWRLRGTREVERIDTPRPKANEVSWLRRRFELALWSEAGQEKNQLLHELMSFLAVRKYRISVDSGWNDWDIEVSRGFWTSARIEVAVENHTGAKRLFRVRTSLHTALVGFWALAACALVAVLGVALNIPELARMGLVLALLDAASLAVQSLRLGRLLFRVMSIVARRLELGPVSDRRKDEKRREAA
jgi:hypothetical protein